MVVLTDGKTNVPSGGIGDPCQGHPAMPIPEIVIPYDVSVFSVNVGADAVPEATDCISEESFGVAEFEQLGLILDDLVLSACQ